MNYSARRKSRGVNKGVATMQPAQGVRLEKEMEMPEREPAASPWWYLPALIVLALFITAFGYGVAVHELLRGVGLVK